MGDEIKKTFWGHRTYCIITGASQGIGRNLAIEFARKFGKDSALLLLARSESGLNETKRLISEANDKVFVKIHSVDLAKPNVEEFKSIIESSLVEFKAKPTDFELATIVHNAGSVGDVKEYASEISDLNKLQGYFSLNLFSAICLNSEFLLAFPENSTKMRLVINITSLCALKPMKSLVYYCVGKASREMFFNVLAEENSSVTVLNYSPGPVNTAMISEVISNVKDNEVKKLFVSLKESQSILSLEQTTQRLINILEKGEFKSGSRIDYFDTEE